MVMIATVNATLTEDVLKVDAVHHPVSSEAFISLTLLRASTATR